MAQISIPGGQGSSNFTFTITGHAAVNYATDFSAAVRNATVISNLGMMDSYSTVAGALNILGDDGMDQSAFTLLGGHQYTYASVLFPLQINGSSAGGDTVLGSGGVTYDADGSGNRVIFDTGDNTYNGGTSSDNTITGGAGNDTINTGTGTNTVFAGDGNTLINLADVNGDVVVLQAGESTVNALGASDTVYASTALGSVTGTIFGGSGLLVFVAAPSDDTLPMTIVGGSGTADMFTSEGSNITFENAAAAGLGIFVAGAGNETLNGSGAAGEFAFFGDTVAADAASINLSVAGGQGGDYFSTGGGNETIVAGSGVALFHINDLGAGTNITIDNLTSGDFFNFAGLSVQQEGTLLSDDSTVSGGNLTVSLQDGTKVEFLNVTSFTGHLV